MEISLIITSYNYAQYIERAIRSALDQSLDNNRYEIIVINDASTDNTIDVIDNYKNSIRLINLEKNVGLSAARNIGVKKAKGQFVEFLDADDYIHEDLLRTQLLFLESNSNLDAVSCDYYKVNEKGEHIDHIDSNKYPIACGIMFRKDYLFHIGLYDERLNAKEEVDLRIRWEKEYNIYNLKIPLYRYRMHKNNLTNDKEKMKQGMIAIKNKYKIN